MWDCKTSKMSQSPLAALNAVGLFAAEVQRATRVIAVGEARRLGRFLLVGVCLW